MKSTNDAVDQSTRENQMIESRLKSTQREVEKLTQEKIELENKILNNLQNQINADQVSRKCCENIQHLQGKRRDLEIKMYKTEENLADVMFQLEKLKGEISRNKQLAEELKVKNYTYNL